MKQDTRSYTLRIPTVLFSRIDQFSRKTGMTQAQVVIQACREFLEPKTPYMAPSTPAGKPDMAALREICAGNLPSDPVVVLRPDVATYCVRSEVEPEDQKYMREIEASLCVVCESPMREVKGKWACQDVSCGKYGVEQKPR